MGKLLLTSRDSEQSPGTVQVRKRNKELAEIRRNALAAKRNQKKLAGFQQTKTNLMNTLHKFAEARKEIENATGSQRILLGTSKTDEDNNELINVVDPFKIRGFIRGGIKGKAVSRPSETEERLKRAILNNDALKLMHSGYLCKLEKPKQNSDELDLEVKKEMAKIFSDSADSSPSIDESLPKELENKPSPFLGRIVRKKSMISLDKKQAEVGTSDKNPSPVMKFFKKEEKCRRKLFEDENLKNKSQKNEHDVNSSSKFLSRKSTPENTIFFTESIPQKKKCNKLIDKRNSKINPINPQLMHCYIQICKTIAEIEIKNIFCSVDDDPLKITKEALKNTYTNAFKDYLLRQKNIEKNLCSNNVATPSSTSEIMLEPDSAICRILQKNNELKTKNTNSISESNSDASSNEFDDFENVAVVDSIENNYLKKKSLPPITQEYDGLQNPSSTKVNRDPESAKKVSAFDSVDQERQELVARYLKDFNTHKMRLNEKMESEITEKTNNIFNEKEKMFTTDNLIETNLYHKSRRHMPAILRKNRSLVNCIAKEKMLLKVGKCTKPNKINKSLESYFYVSDNEESKHAPNCESMISNEKLEAPKCKYVHINAKYNQPSKIDISILQNRKVSSNALPEKNLYHSPIENINKNFVSNYHCNFSPINQQLKLPDNKEHSYEYHLSQNSEIENADFHRYKLSQENAGGENNSMVRMVSFGDIQERTNRLTLRSSQNQNCSQGSADQIYSLQDCRNSHPNFRYQQTGYKFCKNCATYNGQLCKTCNILPASQTFHNELNCDFDCYSHSTIKCNEKHHCIPKNNVQFVPPINSSFSESESINCHINDCQSCREQNFIHSQESSLNCAYQNSQQPMKFLATGENNMPQRRPIYSMNESNYMHKTTIPNEEYRLLMKPSCSKSISNQHYYAIPAKQCYEQDASQSIISSDYGYNNIHEISNTISSNALRSANLVSEISGFDRDSISFVSNNLPNQILITKQTVPIHAVDNNHNYVRQRVQVQRRSPLYSQVGSQHGNNGSHGLQNTYLQQIPQVRHHKRS